MLYMKNVLPEVMSIMNDTYYGVTIKHTKLNLRWVNN